MEGVLTHVQQCKSNFGGECYRCTVICVDGITRTLWCDPRMDNWRHWCEIVQAKQLSKMRTKGIILSGLKALKKKDTNLNADYPPEIIDACDLDEIF